MKSVNPRLVGAIFLSIPQVPFAENPPMLIAGLGENIGHGFLTQSKP